MVLLTTIIHFALYALFAVAFVANLVINRAWPYWILLFLCVIQLIIDTIIVATPDTSAALVTIANIGVLVLALTMQTLVARLFHSWSSSLKRSIPRHRHRFLVWSVNSLHLMHLAVGLLGVVALILLAQPSTILHGITIWSVCLWLFSFLALYLAVLQVLLGFVSYTRIPKNVVEPQRKLRQLIRLFVMTLLLAVYFLFNAIGMYSSSVLQFIGGLALYLILTIAAWPWALYGYEFSPGTREITFDPDGAVVVTETPQIAVENVDHVDDVGQSGDTEHRVSDSLSLVPSSEIRNSEELIQL